MIRFTGSSLTHGSFTKEIQNTMRNTRKLLKDCVSQGLLQHGVSTLRFIERWEWMGSSSSELYKSKGTRRGVTTCAFATLKCMAASLLGDGHEIISKKYIRTKD